MGAAVHRLQRALRVLLNAALEGASIDRRRHPVLVTLLDFPFWDSLDAAVPRGRIPHQIQRLAEAVIRNAR
jgi:hypothetical protein